MSKEIANRIKELRKINGYTQKDFAKLIGVAQTAIANYESGIRVPDAEKLDKIASLFNVTVDSLLGRDNSKVSFNNESENETDLLESVDKIFKTFISYLLRGEKEEARRLIINLYHKEGSLGSIYIGVFEKALKEVGLLWESGSIDVWKEHFISEAILDIMRELKVKHKKAKFKAYSMLALTAGAEMHNIGLKMITDMLENDGWNITYLGSNLPVQSLIKAIEIEKPDVVAISVTLIYHIESAKYAITAVRNYFGKKTPKIIVGGSAFINCTEVCKETGADYYSLDIEDIKVAMKG